MGRYISQSTGPLNGPNENENPHDLKPNDLVKAENVARYGSMTGTRPGLVRPGSGEDYENAIDEGEAIQGFFEWRKLVDATRLLLVVAKHSDFSGVGGAGVFKQDNSRFAAGSAVASGADNIWNFAEHNDLLWAAGGAAASDFWYLDPATPTNAPTTVNLPVSAGSIPRPAYVISWRNYLLVNGMRTGSVADNNQAVTRFCTFGSDPTTAANWHIGNTVGFEAYGSNFTTGFATYSDNVGDFLIILGNKKLHSVVLDPVNEFVITDAIANGCVNQRAYVSLGHDSGEAIYMSNKGIHSLKQSQQYGTKSDTFLSWKIRPTFSTLNRSRLRFVSGAYDHVNGWVIFAVPTGSNPYQDVLLVLDVKDQRTLTAENANWYIWRLAGGIRVQDMKFIRDASNDWKLVIATTHGDILYLSTSVFNDVQVDGSTSAAYSATLQTAHNAHGSILTRKTVNDVMMTLQPGGNYTPIFRTYFDYGRRKSSDRQLTMRAPSQAAWGSAQWGVDEWGETSFTRDEKVYVAGSGRTVSFEITHAGDNEPWRVGGFDYKILQSGEDTGDTASA